MHLVRGPAAKNEINEIVRQGIVIDSSELIHKSGGSLAVIGKKWMVVLRDAGRMSILEVRDFKASSDKHLLLEQSEATE
jgi:hypothetical protein